MEYLQSAWKIKIPKVQRDDVSSKNYIAVALSLPPAYYRKRLKKIGFWGKDTELLDAGCGAGHWAIAASYLNEKVSGIDLTENYLNIAKKINGQFKRKNLHLKLGRLENLPDPDCSFDFILCYNAWMYTNRPESLQEMTRVLKPGGKIYLGCIAGLGWYLYLLSHGFKKNKRSLIFDSLKAIKRKVYTTEQETKKLLKKQGLKILGIGADGQLGDPKIKVTPVGPAKKFGFWNVYEVLAEKPKLSKGMNEN